MVEGKLCMATGRFYMEEDRFCMAGDKLCIVRGRLFIEGDQLCLAGGRFVMDCCIMYSKRYIFY